MTRKRFGTEARRSGNFDRRSKEWGGFMKSNVIITDAHMVTINMPGKAVRLEPEGDSGVIRVDGFMYCRSLSVKAGWSLKARSVVSGHYSVRCETLLTS